MTAQSAAGGLRKGGFRAVCERSSEALDIVEASPAEPPDERQGGNIDGLVEIATVVLGQLFGDPVGSARESALQLEAGFRSGNARRH